MVVNKNFLTNYNIVYHSNIEVPDISVYLIKIRSSNYSNAMQKEFLILIIFQGLKTESKFEMPLFQTAYVYERSANNLYFFANIREKFIDNIYLGTGNLFKLEIIQEKPLIDNRL